MLESMEQKVLAKKLGAEIKRRRLEAGKTQEDLADESRMTTNYISLVERGETNVTLVKATQIAEALGLRLSAIIAAAAPFASAAAPPHPVMTNRRKHCGSGLKRSPGAIRQSPPLHHYIERRVFCRPVHLLISY